MARTVIPWKQTPANQADKHQREPNTIWKHTVLYADTCRRPIVREQQLNNKLCNGRSSKKQHARIITSKKVDARRYDVVYPCTRDVLFNSQCLPLLLVTSPRLPSQPPQIDPKVDTKATRKSKTAKPRLLGKGCRNILPTAAASITPCSCSASPWRAAWLPFSLPSPHPRPIREPKSSWTYELQPHCATWR